MTLTEMLALSTFSYRSVNMFVESDVSALAPLTKELIKAGRMRNCNTFQTGFSVFDQVANQSQTLQDFDTIMTGQRISKIKEGYLTIGGLGQQYLMSETEYQLLIELAKAFPANPSKNSDVVGRINDTIRGEILDKMDNMCFRKLYQDIEYGMLQSLFSDGTTTSPIKGLTSIVNTSGPSAAYGTVDLTALNVTLGKPWYVKASSGTGDTTLGCTLTGAATFGKAEFIKHHTSIVQCSKIRGVNMKWTIVNPSDYSEWQKYNIAIRGMNETVGTGEKNVGKNYDYTQLASAQRAMSYDINQNRLIAMNGTTVIPSVACPAGSAWVIAPDCLNIDVVTPNYAWKKDYAKYNKGVHSLFNVEMKPIMASAAGDGKGALVNIESYMQLVTNNPAGIAYIGYTAATA